MLVKDQPNTHAMRKALTVCTILSLLISAYCYFEHNLPYSQFAKVKSELNAAGVDDKELIERIRWSIVGVRGTWWPILILASIENTLMIMLTIFSFRYHGDAKPDF